MSTFSKAGREGSPGIVRIVPHIGYRNPAPMLARMSRTGSRKFRRNALPLRLVAQAEVGLGHADGQVVVAKIGVELEFCFGLREEVDSVCAVHVGGDDLDLVPNRDVERIEIPKILRLVTCFDHGFGQGYGTGPTL